MTARIMVAGIGVVVAITQVVLLLTSCGDSTDTSAGVSSRTGPTAAELAVERPSEETSVDEPWVATGERAPGEVTELD